jgi:type IV secretion system protein VirB5
VTPYVVEVDRTGAANAIAPAVTDPFAKVGHRAVTAEVTSVVRASDKSFRIAWIEHAYEEGAAIPAERWSAILTVIIQTPRTEERLRKNPLGIYIDAIAWSRELGGNG